MKEQIYLSRAVPAIQNGVILCEPAQVARNIAYIIGALRDGCFTTNRKYHVYRVRIYQKNKEWLENVADKFYEVFGKKPRIIHDNRDGMWCLIIDSKSIYQKLVDICEFSGNQKTWYTPKTILEATSDVKKEYIRGFFDAEGGVPHLEIKVQQQKNIRIYFCQANEKVLQELKTLIEEFEIKCGNVCGPYFKKNYNYPTYGFRIHGIKEVSKFSMIIGCLHPEKIVRLRAIEELKDGLHLAP